MAPSSRCLQQRDFTIELEGVAVYFAVSKYSLYLKGTESFTVATEHQSLEGVFKKDIIEVLYIPTPENLGKTGPI